MLEECTIFNLSLGNSILSLQRFFFFKISFALDIFMFFVILTTSILGLRQELKIAVREVMQEMGFIRSPPRASAPLLEA